MKTFPDPSEFILSQQQHSSIPLTYSTNMQQQRQFNPQPNNGIVPLIPTTNNDEKQNQQQFSQMPPIETFQGQVNHY